MESHKKFMSILVIGLFLMPASEFIRRFGLNAVNEDVADFINGFIKGLGIALTIWAIYRMRKYNATF